MFCKKCGAELPDDSKFCYKCGATIDSISNELKLEKTKELKNYEVKKEISQKSRLAALLFGIFLGGIGIHNFYLGQIGRGILKIVLRILGIFFYIIGPCSAAYSYTVYGNLSAAGLASLSVLSILAAILLIAGSIWAFVEWILIACGKAKDSKDLPVSKW